MKGTSDYEPQIKWRRRRRHHAECVLDGHEEQDPQCEDAGHPVESGHVENVVNRPCQEERLGLQVKKLLGRGRHANVFFYLDGAVTV